MNSKVSIITPVYNASLYIEHTIKSVLSQTYTNWELILTNDCSTDSSESIIRSYMEQDDRITLINLNKNSGATVARNTSIKKATGRYITFLDSDDLWHSDKLSEQVAFMKEHHHAFTYTRYQQINEDGSLTKKFIKAPQKVTYTSTCFINWIGCLTAMYDTNILGKQYFPDCHQREDYALWLKILKHCDGFGIDKSLAYYRLRAGSVSSNKMKLVKLQWNLFHNVEKFNPIMSAFYVACVVFQKVFNIK